MKISTRISAFIISAVLFLQLTACDTFVPNDSAAETTEATLQESTPVTAPETDEDEHLGDPHYSSEFTIGLSFRLNRTENTYYIYGFHGKEQAEVIIPRIYKGCYVTVIDDEVFKDASYLASVTLPDTLTHIGESAFENCTSLSHIELPNGLTHIGKSAFKGCFGFSSIEVPESVTYIGEGAFSGCGKLESIVLPFIGLSSDTKAKQRYVFGAIFGKSNYDGSIKVTQYWQLGGGAVSKTEYYLPKDLRSVTITGGDIPYGSFYNCSRLKSIILPEGATAISSYSFDGCSSLTDIIIPDSVTVIGAAAFYGCVNIKSINIPKGVTRIESIAFKNCSGLKSINFDGTMEEWQNIEKLDDWNANTGKYTVYCTNGTIAK